MKTAILITLLLSFSMLFSQVEEKTKEEQNQKIIEQNQKIIEQNNKILEQQNSNNKQQQPNSNKQEQVQNNATNKPNKEKAIYKIYTGGNFGIAINSDYTSLILEPLIGYKVSERVYVGGKFTYRHSRNYTWNKKTYNDYGGSIYARLYALPILFFHIEPAFMNYQYTSDNSIRKTVPFIWLGSGLRRNTSSNSWVTAQVLFDVYNHPDSPYNRWQPFISVGVGFGL